MFDRIGVILAGSRKSPSRSRNFSNTVARIGCALAAVFGFALLSVSFVPATLQAQDAQTGTIAGAISEAATKEPIVNAAVRVEGTEYQTSTGRSGRFRISEVPAGTYTLVVEALGYGAAERSDIAVRAGEMTQVDVGLSIEPMSLDRIVVSATKEALSIGEIASQVEVLNAEEIQQRGNAELTDAVQNTPGVTISTQAGSFHSIEMRGMPRQNNEFMSTLLLIDGVPQTDSRNSARLINVPIHDASSIEILRGPNSALYGRTAIGGSINIQTVNPTTDPQATVRLEGGSFGRRKADVSASGPISDWGGYYLSWAKMGSDGFYTGDPHYDIDENSAFGKFTANPDDKSSVMVTFENVVSDNSLPTSVPVIDGEILSRTEPGFDVFSNINFPSSNYHQEELRFTFNYDRQLGEHIRFSEIFGYRDILFQFEETGEIIGQPIDPLEKQITSYPFSMDQDEQIFYQEARFTISPDLGVENGLVTGFSFEDNSGSKIGDLIYTDPATFGIPINYMEPEHPDRSEWQYFTFGGDEYHLQNLGFYAQYRISPVPWLKLSAAGRYDRMNMENIQTLAEGNPTLDRVYDAFSPKISATFSLLRDEETEMFGRTSLNVYANYSEAFLPPRSPTQIQEEPEDFTPPTLVPEDIRNYEAGLKGTFWEERVSLDATYFQMDRTGIVVSLRQEEGPFYHSTNAGEQDFEGVEFSLRVRPTERLSLFANGALYHHRFGDFRIETEGGSEAFDGKRLPIVPDQNLNLGGELQLTDEVGVSGDVQYMGDRFADRSNTFLLDSYTLFDGSIFYRNGPFSVTLSAHNLTDEIYFNNGSTSSVSPAPPRQILLNTSYTFR